MLNARCQVLLPSGNVFHQMYEKAILNLRIVGERLSGSTTLLEVGKIIGSSGRTRTYNPPVTHNPMFSHGSGLSHQLSPKFPKKVAGRFWDIIGLAPQSLVSARSCLHCVRTHRPFRQASLRVALPARAGLGFPARQPFSALATLQESLGLPP
jgi:hypothetical protein